jgi:hypothetical protein
MEHKFTGPMEVPPSRNPDRHVDCASTHSLSTINLFNLIPVRLSSENLQRKRCMTGLLFTALLYLWTGMVQICANLVREASLERRLSIALPEMGLFFPVNCKEIEDLHMNIANSMRYTRSLELKYLMRDVKGPTLHGVHLQSFEQFLM